MEKRLSIVAGGVVFTMALVMGGCGDDDGAEDVTSAVREAIAGYETPEDAEAGGWRLVDGLDHCFENPGVGAMGVHYIDAERLDTTVDELAPEAIIYATNANGEEELVAVEYIVPAEAWDGEGHESLPEALGQTFHLNEELGVYVLHAWIFKENPMGMFQDWNPDVTCI